MALQWLSTPWADGVNAAEASGATPEHRVIEPRWGGWSRSIGGQ